eukprot:8536088-Alexandrium_andersonii.AAC.1
MRRCPRCCCPSGRAPEARWKAPIRAPARAADGRTRILDSPAFAQSCAGGIPVSYTHLTLPTICSV